MKINEKFGYNIITAGCENQRSNSKYPIGKKDDSRFYLINFHPAGEPEAFIWLRYQGFGIGHYCLVLECLAYESLRLVQNSGIKLACV
jgi:hypothetical protein